MLSDSTILKHITHQPKRSAGFQQLVRELGLHGSARRELDDRLQKLVASGQLTRSDSDHYALPQATSNKNLVAGRLTMHRDGFGFVIPDANAISPSFRSRLVGDIFIAPHQLGNAMHGDQVLVDMGAIRPDGRAEGRIVRSVERAHGSRHNYVKAIDSKITQEIVIPPGMEIPLDQVGHVSSASSVTSVAGSEGEARQAHRTDGAKRKAGRTRSVDRVLGEEAARRLEGSDLEGVVVDVEIVDWPTTTQNPRGRVIEILGQEDDFGVDVEIMIRKFHLPHRFPAEVLEQAQSVPAVIPGHELHHRRDFRHLPIVTIDGETARDFDDAVMVSTLPNGNFELQVHIADVAHYVTPGSPLDQEARLRGTSVYFPDRAVPMLPLELSTDICSLRPQTDRLVMSCVMEIDPRGEIVRYELSNGVIRSAERMTYTAVNAVLQGDPVVRERYAALVPGFELMRDLALILNRKRHRRGSIDFDLPEPVIEFDELGLMKSITRSERNMAHRLIEEFMLAANECVAEYIESKRTASLYRVHEKPDAKRVYDFEVIAATFGWSAAHPAGAPESRPAIVLWYRQARPRDRSAQGSSHHAAHVSEIGGEDRGEAGGTHSQLPDASVAQAGTVFGRESGAFRVGGDQLHALYIADPTLSGPHRAQDFERCAARFSGKAGRRCAGGNLASRWKRHDAWRAYRSFQPGHRCSLSMVEASRSCRSSRIP